MTSAARDHDGTWIEAGPDTEIVAGGDSAEEETAMFAAEIVRQSSAASVRVKVRCVACHHEHEVGPGEVAAMDVPMCPKCFSPCVAVEASRG